MAEAFVDVWRGELIESRHRISVAVVDASGQLRAHAGNGELVAFARSAAKPIQALAVVEDGAADRFDFTAAEVALCCASHSGEPRHVEAARSMLRKIGADEEALACGPHAPLSKTAARQLEESGLSPTRIHNNCSGKHVGMLALARFNGWSLNGYQSAEHPVQERMMQEMVRWTGVASEEIATATDGCGVVTFAVPLVKLAEAFAKFAAAARRADASAARIVQAMVKYPEYVGGTDRFCTELMRVARGRIFVKTGAEGVYCAGVPGAELGIVVKVEDGSARAAEPALGAVLKSLALLSDEEFADLESFVQPDVSNTRGERVGVIRAAIELEPGA
jgi:L-asparaginase II